MNKLESRLANQSDSDSLITNEAYDTNFTLLKITGILPNELSKPCAKTCQCLAFKIFLWYTLAHEILTTDQPLTYN